jgi:MFS family permease
MGLATTLKKPFIMKGDFRNIFRASLCCLGFLCLYTALYSAQNIQSVILDDDGYGKLGFYSNAVSYVAQAIGSIAAMAIMEGLGDRKTMAWGSCFCIPFIVCLVSPALKYDYPDSKNFFLS